MRMTRKLAVGLVATLAMALSAAAVALAVEPGDWVDSKRKFSIAVTNDGTGISGFNWQCKANRQVVRGFPNKPRNIRANNRFRFKGKAKVFQGESQAGTTTLR